MYRMVEYVCDDGHRFEELVEAPPPQLRACLHCGVPAELAISAAKCKRFFVSVARGKPEPPPPGALSTCPPEYK